jgi:ABC-type nitrate/sulfonate/bicarbonate transport system ATPase subunit
MDIGSYSQWGPEGKLTLRVWSETIPDISTQARITLARAVYSSADIILLDDVLAALDVHTSKWIVDKCFKGDLLRGRTVLLVV